jgi:uncharacterized protein
MEERMASLDWQRIADELDSGGVTLVEGLLRSRECERVRGLYDSEHLFRRRVVMEQHGYGRGEYQYFSYPLPDIVAALRVSTYGPLAVIANSWSESLGSEIRYPASHGEFIQRCHKAGQTRPTPLLLRYRAGDYNCLHQDLYGEQVFPLQLVIMLAQPDRDFRGGEFILTEQRPRMQSRARVVPLQQGDAVIFAVNQRPAKGKRGFHRVHHRHGVSTVHTGLRHTLGIIYHDAL